MASPCHTGIRRCFAPLASATLAILILYGTCSCLQFSYPSFGTANEADFSFSPGAGIADGALQITPSTEDLSHRSGRVCYARETLKLWNRRRTALTSFRTEFVLNVVPRNGTGEGMAFILTNNPELPGNSSGQWLGLVNSQTDGSPANRIVAVESTRGRAAGSTTTTTMSASTSTASSLPARILSARAMPSDL